MRYTDRNVQLYQTRAESGSPSVLGAEIGEYKKRHHPRWKIRKIFYHLQQAHHALDTFPQNNGGIAAHQTRAGAAALLHFQMEFMALENVVQDILQQIRDGKIRPRPGIPQRSR